MASYASRYSSDPLERHTDGGVSAADIERLIATGGISAEPQRGIHRSFIVAYNGVEYFYKDYTVHPHPASMLAELAAHRLAGSSAPLFYREALAGYRIAPHERSRLEGRTLEAWSRMGIDAPRVVSVEGRGIVMTWIRGLALDERLVNATLGPEHVSSLTEALGAVREAALYHDDPLLFHSDAKLSNAIGRDDGTVALIDPGMLVRQLPTRVLDAAHAISYLASLRRNGLEHDAVEVTGELASGYAALLDRHASSLVLEHARPVTPWLPRAIAFLPNRGARWYANWLASFDEGFVTYVERLIG